ncbi:MAG: integrase arm-type DNA-binding domain-containing protein [Pseudomonadota bacterium]
MQLTDLKCKNAKPGEKVRKLADGGGLQLWVQPTGSKQWRLAYRYGGKQKLFAIGPYPLVGLSEARDAAREAKKHLNDGVDPMSVKREAQIKAAAETNTFKVIAEEYLDKRSKEGRAKSTMSKLEWLLSLAYADIGPKPIAKLKPADILVALRRIEARGNFETARRLRSTIGSVCRYAVATSRAEFDPTASLQGALITHKSKPRSAITDPVELGQLLRSIDGYNGMPSVRAALTLMPILFPRPGELRQAHWEEFDFGAAVWSIPAERMKMRRAHKVPLPKQAIDILQELKRQSFDTALAFPGPRSIHRPISDNAMTSALRNMGYTKEQVVPHGFRATASTLLNESGKWKPDAIERQLAHQEQNEVRRVYARGEHWEERVNMMQWWADYLDQLKQAS